VILWRYGRINLIFMRVFFTKKIQKRFINTILSKISVQEAARLCNLSERTIRDWRREKFSMDLDALRKLCRKTRTPFPYNVKLKDDYWYTVNGSSAGGIAVFKKYGRIGGDPEYRKKRWHKWWEREGRHKKHPIIGIARLIKKPHFSKELAEFVGIIIGDGGITKNQVTITLNSKDDKEYIKFVIALIKKLFNVHIGTHYRKKYQVVNLNISRSELVRFCTERLGLKCGNKIKQQVDIPDWIKRNNLYSIACTRGLIDTDGCIFNHRYKVNSKFYNYKKLVFTSYSGPLRQSVFNIFKNIGLNPRLAQDRDVRLDSIDDMQRFFQVVGSNNPKHLRKYFK